MAAVLHPDLVNGACGDPALFIDLRFERRALLADLGDLQRLPPRKLLRLTHVFVSHTHVDHFNGLDRLLRVCLGRGRALTLFGPPGFIAQVGHKLAAYTWNLAANYPQDLIIEAVEASPVAPDWRQGPSPPLLLRRARFRLHGGFGREDVAGEVRSDGLLTEAGGVRVSAAVLDHGVPCLAFAFHVERHLGVIKAELARLGLTVGPWLRELRQAVLAGLPDETPIRAADGVGSALGRLLPLGAVRQCLRPLPGQKVAYVVDCGYGDETAARVTALAEGAEILFIEAAFAEADAGEAAARHHLTARQAGSLARRAGVKRLVPFHFSPRYQGRWHVLADEALAAFRGAA